MRYQWGLKSPFTFATSSESNGPEYGKYTVKIYTIDGVLIYQDNIGDSNKDKQPVGGIIISSAPATSMMETIKNPITLYGYYVINPSGRIKDLWDYYWTSYSRGPDGRDGWSIHEINYHNNYLDGYTSQRAKSIYDPCPYMYRIPSNGVFNQFNSYSGWTAYSYVGGLKWNILDIFTWLTVVDVRAGTSFMASGRYSSYRTSTSASLVAAYVMEIGFDGRQFINGQWDRAYGYSVRCIEDCDPLVSPPRPTDEARLRMEVVFIPVSKTVTLLVCIINGGVKIRLHLQQVVKLVGVLRANNMVSIPLRCIL